MIKIVQIAMPRTKQLEELLNSLEKSGNTIIAVSSGETNWTNTPIVSIVYRTKKISKRKTRKEGLVYEQKKIRRRMYRARLDGD